MGGMKPPGQGEGAINTYLRKQYLEPYEAKRKATAKVGEAKVRKEPLKNTPDKKSSRSRKFNTPISSAGSAKKSKGGKVAALLKTKDAPKKEDKLG